MVPKQCQAIVEVVANALNSAHRTSLRYYKLALLTLTTTYGVAMGGHYLGFHFG